MVAGLTLVLKIIKEHVNKDGSGSHAFYSVGMWTCLAAMVLLFFTTFIVLFSCFQSRKERRNGPPRPSGKHRWRNYNGGK